MQLIFLVILIGALAAGVIVLALLGWAQRRRRLKLTRVAHAMGLKFSADDPFDLTNRYRGFVLPSAGHSPRADNVIYGRHRGWSVRAFDYYFEAGHGPHRLGRRYGVIVADTDVDLRRALMWHGADPGPVPIAAATPGGEAGPWHVVHGGASAAALAEAFGGFADEPVNVQTDRRSVMLCAAGRWKPDDLSRRIDAAVGGLENLKARWGGA